MSKSINHLKSIFDMNSRLFTNALEGVTDEQAAQRQSGHSNPLIWIATHTVWARYNTLMFLGKPAKNPYEGLFENFKPFNAADKYPTLENIKKEWATASDLLKQTLNSATEEQLAAESPLKSPIGDFTNGGTVAFLAQHESYDIGQMAYLKKFHTKEAMKYN
jgi:hypothetical protein